MSTDEPRRGRSSWRCDFCPESGTGTEQECADARRGHVLATGHPTTRERVELLGFGKHAPSVEAHPLEVAALWLLIALVLTLLAILAAELLLLT